jgi:hypothetical protein
MNDLFTNKPAIIRDLYDELISQIKKIGPMDIHAGKWNITLRSGSTFFSVNPEKTYLGIVFVRDEALDDFPVYQCHQYSKNRWSNHVKIEDFDEIDKQLLGWIRDAYEICK